jgi:hypothetical protein
MNELIKEGAIPALLNQRGVYTKVQRVQLWFSVHSFRAPATLISNCWRSSS